MLGSISATAGSLPYALLLARLYRLNKAACQSEDCVNCFCWPARVCSACRAPQHSSRMPQVQPTGCRGRANHAIYHNRPRCTHLHSGGNRGVWQRGVCECVCVMPCVNCKLLHATVQTINAPQQNHSPSCTWFCGKPWCGSWATLVTGQHKTASYTTVSSTRISMFGLGCPALHDFVTCEKATTRLLHLQHTQHAYEPVQPQTLGLFAISKRAHVLPLCVWCRVFNASGGLQHGRFASCIQSLQCSCSAVCG